MELGAGRTANLRRDLARGYLRRLVWHSDASCDGSLLRASQHAGSPRIVIRVLGSETLPHVVCDRWAHVRDIHGASKSNDTVAVQPNTQTLGL